MKILWTIKGLFNLKTVVRVITAISIAACAIGFFMIVTSLGSFDYADAAHQTLSDEEYRKLALTIIVSFVAIAASIILGATCDKINAAIDDELERRREIAAKKRRAALAKRAEQDREYREYRDFADAHYPVSSKN